MKQIERTFRTKFLLWMVSFSCLLFLLVMAFLKGILSLRGFGIAGIFISVSGAIALMLIFQSIQKSVKEYRNELGSPDGALDADERERSKRQIRVLKRAIGFMVFALIYGLLETKDYADFFFPRLIGAAVNLCITGWLIHTLVRAQKNLK